MKKKTFFLYLNLLASIAIMAQAPETFYGAWKADLSKSKFSPGPAPKSNLKTYSPVKDGFKAHQDLVTADGKQVSVDVPFAKLDGKDYPGKGSADADTYAFTKIDAHTFQIVQKKDGKVTITAKMVVSADGKTRSITQTETNAKGEKVNNTVYWERQ